MGEGASVHAWVRDRPSRVSCERAPGVVATQLQIGTHAAAVTGLDATRLQERSV
jgi:hypothetical protein